MVCVTSKASDQPAHTLCLLHEYSMSDKLLTEHHLEFLSLEGGYTGSSKSTFIKIPHCGKSHVAAHIWNNPSELKGLKEDAKHLNHLIRIYTNCNFM